jgi:alkanesulfonate monooxygenase SsuD/methylene tetrahydromethanopterin reductase-like flavin-dependent oxidoreductase (luciferase family)
MSATREQRRRPSHEEAKGLRSVAGQSEAASRRPTDEYLVALGFDLVFGLAQWLGKGGYGGDMHFREHEVDPIIANAALAALTKSIVLINTVHVLYAWHPLHLARFGTAIDHSSGGR